MEGLGKLLLVGVVFLPVVVLGSVLLSSPVAAGPTVGFPGGFRVVDPVRARPCDMAAAVSFGAGTGVGAPENEAKVLENHAPAVLLNVLPRGKFPPSGPSPHINEVKT